MGLVDEVKPDIEQPPIIKAKKVSKAINTASKDKEQLLGLIALSLGTVYNITATKYGNHWRLSEPELNTLSVATQDALETLPEGIYTDVLKIVGKYGAWFALAYAAYSITEPRISESIRVKRLKYQPVNRVANESNNVSERSDSKEPNVSNIDRTPYTPASAYGYAAAASQQNP